LDEDVLDKVVSHPFLALWVNGLLPDPTLDLPPPTLELQVEWNIFPEDGPFFLSQWVWGRLWQEDTANLHQKVWMECRGS